MFGKMVGIVRFAPSMPNSLIFLRANLRLRIVTAINSIGDGEIVVC